MAKEDKEDPWDAFTKEVKPIAEKYRSKIGIPTGKPYFSFEERASLPRERFMELPLENYTVQRTKQGRSKKVVWEQCLDLHGYTRQQALTILQRFLKRLESAHSIWVLIITGKGKQDNPHALRYLVPQWLEQLSMVGEYCVAKPHDGGEGAYYVRLKRLKKKGEI